MPGGVPCVTMRANPPPGFLSGSRPPAAAAERRLDTLEGQDEFILHQ